MFDWGIVGDDIDCLFIGQDANYWDVNAVIESLC